MASFWRGVHNPSFCFSTFVLTKSTCEFEFFSALSRIVKQLWTWSYHETGHEAQPNPKKALMVGDIWKLKSINLSFLISAKWEKDLGFSFYCDVFCQNSPHFNFSNNRSTWFKAKKYKLIKNDLTRKCKSLGTSLYRNFLVWNV